MDDKRIKIAIIGAGTRGSSLAKNICKYNDLAEIVAVAEPNHHTRDKFVRDFNIDKKYAFECWSEMLKSSFPFDAVVIATLDNSHTEPTVAFLERGCHIISEKPMADTKENCEKILQAQEKAGKIIAVCHTLRFDEGFKKVKMLVEQGTIGKIMTINQMEEIGNTRFVHNYVRGKWGNDNYNTTLLLHKSCHDLDYIAWLVGSKCKNVSSFGSLDYFTSKRAPQNSADRCTNNCHFESQCPYSAIKTYVKGDLTKWPARDVCQNHTYDAHLEAIKTGPYGQCAWRANNNVVDHQVVIMEFECGATATFTMNGFTYNKRRILQVYGTEGEINFDESKKQIIIRRFDNTVQDTIKYEARLGYHPEDDEIVKNWIDSINSNNQDMVQVSGKEAFENLKIVFDAEQSRMENS